MLWGIVFLVEMQFDLYIMSGVPLRRAKEPSKTMTPEPKIPFHYRSNSFSRLTRVVILSDKLPYPDYCLASLSRTLTPVPLQLVNVKLCLTTVSVSQFSIASNLCSIRTIT